MKKNLKILLAAALMVLIALAVSGCMSASADDLYALPQFSDDYIQLQGLINRILESGAEYAAPSAGSYRQAIQQEDVDGDGEKEAIAFFNFLGSDRPLRIYIFRLNNGVYEEAAVIEGEGAGIESIGYMDMDGDGAMEIAVGWQLSSGINMLSVYSLKGYQVSQVINTDYTEFSICNLDSQYNSSVLVLRISSSELTGEAEIYSMTDETEIVMSSCRLTNGIEALLRVRSTQLADGKNAIAIESSYSGSGIVTDLLTVRNGQLQNITMDESAGVSSGTIRSYSVYCRDINGDGVLDIPVLVSLPSFSENVSYYMIEWYSYYSTGAMAHICTTYNNTSDNWYMVLPDDWIGNITVRRESSNSGERSIIFSKVDEEGRNSGDFLAIYALTGDNRAERATYADRFVLLAEEDTIYAASILMDETELGLDISQELIRENFHIIYSEWITGET